MAFAKPSIKRRLVRYVPSITIMVAYSCIPLLGIRGFWLDVLTRANIFALLTLSLDLYSGTTFYLNLGISFIAGSSAYVVALLYRYLGMVPEYSIIPAIAVAIALSTVIFLPSIRVRGVYFSVLSLLLPLIMVSLITSQPLSLYLGGEGGIPLPSLFSSYARMLPPRERIPFLQLTWFYLTTALTIVAAVLSYKLAYSNFGFMLRAIGQDEELAEASGIDTTRVKLLGFLVSSTLAATAGALYAAIRPPVTVDVLIPANTLVPPLTAVILGGMGTIIGPLATNYITIVAYELLWDAIGRWRTIAYMLLLIVLVILKPQGVVFHIYLKLRKAIATKLSSVTWR